MNSAQTKALKEARHELVTLNGLLAADGAAPSDTWTINTTPVIEALDVAFSEPDDSDTGPF